MEAGESYFNQIGKGILDLQISENYFVGKNVCLAANSNNTQNINFKINDKCHLSDFNGQFSSYLGSLNIGINENSRSFSYSPSIPLPPVFSLQNYGNNPYKSWVFSGQFPIQFPLQLPLKFPFQFRNLQIILNAMKSSKETSVFADLLLPLNYKDIHITSHLLISPEKGNYLMNSLFKIEHPIFGFCTSLQKDKMIIHSQINFFNSNLSSLQQHQKLNRNRKSLNFDRNSKSNSKSYLNFKRIPNDSIFSMIYNSITEYVDVLNLFNDVKFENDKLSSFSVGGTIENNIAKLGYIYNLRKSLHKMRFSIDLEKFAFGVETSSSVDNVDFHYGLSFELFENEFSFRFGKDKKFVTSTNIPIFEYGNVSMLVGFDSFNYRKPNLGISLLLVE
ncbi:hypothetical protein TRFO_08146 [Tritrichomonas foetus]|uniref:Uncharacterized protein n=1 Tax=Tritrichomonas foetus TaxID=1144522 RepID=A0A1J4JMD3_9EUKA|nr:hypothetical protein TRFO_08146 [Tritrichomonas foetus]|eukprot:OHS99857.1 hypothetical protein TRFO_08146 [Tritrichomonas foetus]